MNNKMYQSELTELSRNDISFLCKAADWDEIDAAFYGMSIGEIKFELDQNTPERDNEGLACEIWRELTQ